MGWGALIGGEITDFVLVLNTDSAVDAFSGTLRGYLEFFPFSLLLLTCMYVECLFHVVYRATSLRIFLTKRTLILQHGWHDASVRPAINAVNSINNMALRCRRSRPPPPIATGGVNPVAGATRLHLSGAFAMRSLMDRSPPTFLGCLLVAGRGQVSIGAELSVAVGPVGRTGAGNVSVAAEGLAHAYSCTRSASSRNSIASLMEICC